MEGSTHPRGAAGGASDRDAPAPAAARNSARNLNKLFNYLILHFTKRSPVLHFTKRSLHLTFHQEVLDSRIRRQTRNPHIFLNLNFYKLYTQILLKYFTFSKLKIRKTFYFGFTFFILRLSIAPYPIHTNSHRSSLQSIHKNINWTLFSHKPTKDPTPIFSPLPKSWIRFF